MTAPLTTNAIDATLQRARSFMQQGLAQQAALALRTALGQMPETAPENAAAAALHIELAQVLRSLGDGQGATMHFERAATLEPAQLQHRLMLMLHQGNLLDVQGETLAARDAFAAAADAFPESADAWAMLGAMLLGLSDLEGAVQAFGRALQLDPARLVVMDSFAAALMSLRKVEDAVLVYERMYQLEPGRPRLAGNLLHCKYLLGDWLQLDRLQRHVQAELDAGRDAAEPFGLQGWCADPALLLRAAVGHAGRKCPPRLDLLPKPALGRGSKIRVGYVAGEFREQATSVLLTEVLERHDRSRFEVFAFDSGWDDGSPRRRRLEAAATFVPITGISDLDAARQVRGHAIDVLVNLNGYFGQARNGIFSVRAAAVQVNYLGFPGTIGAPYMDYIVADPIVIPEDERRHYVEQVVYLPDSYQPNDSTRPVSDWPATRSDAGLPDGAFVFCCLNNAYKIIPSVFDVWMRLLQAAPGSVLLLFGDKPELQANLRHEAQQRGVDPARVLFAPPWRNADHLRRLQLCDLFLDTWPYNAHTTGSDALWAGLPVLTLAGRSFPSRVGASLLQAVGLPELVTHSLADYEALALRLFSEPGWLAALRLRLQSQVRASRLYDTARYTRHLEAAYGQMVARARAGQPAQAFAVAPLDAS